MTTSFLAPTLAPYLPWLYVESSYWTWIGLFGNALFTSRFVVQWIKSERRGQLVVPPLFWHLSFWGSIVSLFYAFHVDKLPVVLSYLFLPFMHYRNLRLLGRTKAPPTE
jgi:lipid-A-disaccharide synthase-like uncharacterized protein